MPTFTLDIISGKAFIFNKNFNVSGTTVSVGDFNIYTASTQPNEIQLIHTGETQVNNITPTALDWNIVQYSGNSYVFTGGSVITIVETGDYLISYNILLRNQDNNEKSIGSNIILNNDIVIDETAAGISIVKGTGNVSALNLATTKISLNMGDNLKVTLFRNGRSGDVDTIKNSSLLKISKSGRLS